MGELGLTDEDRERIGEYLKTPYLERSPDVLEPDEPVEAAE